MVRNAFLVFVVTVPALSALSALSTLHVFPALTAPTLPALPSLPPYSAGIIFNTRNTWGALGGVGVCVRVNPSYRGSVTTVGIYHCDTIVTAEDRHGLCPRDDGYSTGIIFNTRITWGG